jgi:hypothetical protein
LVKQQVEKIATHFITKSNIDDVIPIIKQAVEDLDYGRFEAKDMQFTEQLDKSPNQYPNDKDIRVKVLGLELGAGKGELVFVANIILILVSIMLQLQAVLQG